MTPKGKLPTFLEEWRASSDHYFTPTTYLNQPAGVPFVIATQWLYSPFFVEYRGGVFYTEHADGLSPPERSAIDGWLEKYNGNIARAEQLSNWLILWDLFTSVEISDFDGELVQLAQTIRDVWSALLQAQFRNREFEVEFHDDDDHGPQVTFYQKK